MSRKIELLAPGGDLDSIKAAIVAGADAVYCGLNKFNARNRAENITFDSLNGILRLAHKNNCEVFLTLNISIVEPEIPYLFGLLNKLVNTSIDGVIIQDLGLFYIIRRYFNSLKIHASTQLTTHNKGQLEFLSKLNATRVNLSRELSSNEIKSLSAVAHKNKQLIEVFVHGSYCLSYSGICYMSSLQSGNSGNRGRCSQPCRDEYLTPNGENNFPLNLKDNSAWFDLQELADAGVDSIKIEGRIKKFHYVYSVVTAYKQQLQNVYNKVTKSNDNSVLYKVFNRDFSNAFLKGDINKNMFINNPRDNSSTHLAKQNGGASTENIDKAEMALYAEKGQMREFIKHKIDQLNAEKAPVVITVSGKVDSPLHLHVKAPETSFVLHSEINLVNKGIMPVDEKMLLKRLKAINETEYFIKEIDLTNIEGEIFIPFSELTALKNRILYTLKNSKETLAPVAVPVLTKANKLKIKPNLAILIDSEKDIALSNKTKAIFYFQLPSHIVNRSVELIQLFTKNKNIIPWFPSVLIGENYSAALDFLKQVQPKLIVANNTGIAYEANKMGIEWIAGPFLNSTNSYALKCLKEELNCAGAFISNELNKEQIQRIKKPDDFNLYFSIYHPIVLMSSRQCLFHTTVGCKKNTMDESCMPFCSKATSITNLKTETFFIHKSQGNYNTVYNEKNYLNTKIITDIPNRFSGFLIDLRDIKTTTKIKVDKAQLISLFEHHIANNPDSEKDIHQSIAQTTSIQYVNGI